MAGAGGLAPAGPTTIPVMRQAILVALGAGLLVLALAFALPLWQMGQMGKSGPATPAQRGLPWQVDPGADGSAQVFGLRLGHDRLAEADERFGDAMQTALVARAGEVGVLEALVDPMNAGFVSGRLVLAFDVPAATLERWRGAATASQVMDGGVRRFTLLPAHRREAGGMAIAGLSFVPALRLSEADLVRRFGAPTERLGLPDGAVQLVYPAIGMEATLRPGARGVLQYVAPRELQARLRAPLAPSNAASAP